MNTTFDRAWSGDQGTLKSVRGKDGVACSSAELLTLKHSSIAIGIKDQNSGMFTRQHKNACQDAVELVVVAVLIRALV